MSSRSGAPPRDQRGHRDREVSKVFILVSIHDLITKLCVNRLLPAEAKIRMGLLVDLYLVVWELEMTPMIQSTVVHCDSNLYLTHDINLGVSVGRILLIAKREMSLSIPAKEPDDEFP